MPGAPDLVYIVESPSPHDFLEDRSEGRLLKEGLEISGNKAIHTIAVDRPSLSEALSSRLGEVLIARKVGRFPLLHLSAHGDRDGIGLTDGDHVKWAELREMLRDINEAFDGSLIVCLSSCEGHSGCAMAMEDSEKLLPFRALISHVGKPTWGDAAMGFLTFYHLLFKGRTIDEIMPAVKAASGDDGFIFELGEEVRGRWAESRKSYEAAWQRLIDRGEPLLRTEAPPWLPQEPQG